MAMLIDAIITLAPIALPVVLALIANSYGSGQIEAKLCFAAFSFDIWAITTALRSQQISAPLLDPHTTWIELVIYSVFLIFLHVLLHRWCVRLYTERYNWILRLLGQQGQRMIQIFLISVSLAIPISLLVPGNYFYP